MTSDSYSTWQARQKVWEDFVSTFSRALVTGGQIQTGPSTPALLAPTDHSEDKIGAKVLMFSPHPDDEALIGGLALRLRVEMGTNVTNCAVTLGSNKVERPRRREEVEAACKVLGFELVVPGNPSGLEKVTPHSRKESPSEWSKNVECIYEVLRQEQPDLIFLPHAEDFNPTHIGTHLLVTDTLRRWRETVVRRPVVLIETEYWHELSEPNLLVGLRNETVATLVMAVAEHGGEVSRNPYHIRLPARLIDNARRGAEVVGGPGAAGCNFTFAELYRVSFLAGGEILWGARKGLIIGPEEKMQVTDLVEYFSPR